MNQNVYLPAGAIWWKSCFYSKLIVVHNQSSMRIKTLYFALYCLTESKFEAPVRVRLGRVVLLNYRTFLYLDIRVV